MNVPYTIRPIEAWPGTRTPDDERKWSRFDSTNSATLQLLSRELDQLRADDVVLQLDIREQDLRIDGGLRANARPQSPGVVLTFTSRTSGTMRFAVDRFTDAWDNLRAIALGMEALRKIERYGIANDDQQYSGWRQIEAPVDERPMSTIEAAEFLVKHGMPDAESSGTAGRWVEALVRGAGTTEARSILRAAAKRLHPDTGGDPALFRRLQAAREALNI